MDTFSYLLGKKSSGGGGGGGSSIDWSEIGYANEPQAIIDGFNYAKTIQQNWDSNVTNRAESFKNDYKLLYFPDVDTSKIQNANNMFQHCYSLEEIGENFDFSSITSCGNMFQDCYNLKKIGDINLGNAYGSSIFSNCISLKEINSITMPLSSLSLTIFTGCKELETIKEIKSGTNKKWENNSFYGCNKLSNQTLKVILRFLKEMINQSSNKKTLATIGLSQTQAETCTTFDEWTDLANNGWTTGY